MMGYILKNDMLLLSLFCSDRIWLCTVGSEATERQLTPGEPHTFLASPKVAFGDPWNATPNSTGMLKCLLSLLGTRLPNPNETVGAARLKTIFPLPVTGRVGSLKEVS